MEDNSSGQVPGSEIRPTSPSQPVQSQAWDVQPAQNQNPQPQQSFPTDQYSQTSDVSPSFQTSQEPLANSAQPMPQAPASSQFTQAPQTTQPMPDSSTYFQPSQPQPSPQSAGVQTASFGAAPAKPKRKFLKVLAFSFVASLVLMAGTAGAYFGYYLPNQPDNIVLNALADAVAQNSLVTEGKIDITSKKESTAVAIDYKLEQNREQSQYGISGTVGVSGTRFTYDARMLEKDIYLKVSGLDSIGTLMGLGSNDPALSQFSDAIEEADDQWYVVDRSFWAAMGQETSCVTDLTFTFTDQDIDMIKEAYKKHPLFKVKSSSAEKVGDIDTTKYIVEPSSDAEANAFLSELDQVSVVKKVKDCLRETGAEKAIDEELDAMTEEEPTVDDVTMALYITSDKKLKKIESTAEDKDMKVSVDAVYNFTSVSVAKPEGAKPLQDLFAGLMESYYSSFYQMGGNTQFAPTL